MNSVGLSLSMVTGTNVLTLTSVSHPPSIIHLTRFYGLLYKFHSSFGYGLVIWVRICYNLCSFCYVSFGWRVQYIQEIRIQCIVVMRAICWAKSEPNRRCSWSPCKNRCREFGIFAYLFAFPSTYLITHTRVKFKLYISK